MATMPRILAEIIRVEDQLKSIELEMNTLTEQLNSLDQRNVAGVEDLSRLVRYPRLKEPIHVHSSICTVSGHVEGEHGEVQSNTRRARPVEPIGEGNEIHARKWWTALRFC